jgi:hypothetical protein
MRSCVTDTVTHGAYQFCFVVVERAPLNTARRTASSVRSIHSLSPTSSLAAYCRIISSPPPVRDTVMHGAYQLCFVVVESAPLNTARGTASSIRSIPRLLRPLIQQPAVGQFRQRHPCAWTRAHGWRQAVKRARLSLDTHPRSARKKKKRPGLCLMTQSHVGSKHRAGASVRGRATLGGWPTARGVGWGQQCGSVCDSAFNSWSI